MVVASCPNYFMQKSLGIVGFDLSPFVLLGRFEPFLACCVVLNAPDINVQHPDITVLLSHLRHENVASKIYRACNLKKKKRRKEMNLIKNTIFLFS